MHLDGVKRGQFTRSRLKSKANTDRSWGCKVLGFLSRIHCIQGRDTARDSGVDISEPDQYDRAEGEVKKVDNDKHISG
jgi:hypothetical protein